MVRRSPWEPAQWAHNVKMTSYQRRCDVITSHRRWYDVILMLCACLEWLIACVLPNSWCGLMTRYSIVCGNISFKVSKAWILFSSSAVHVQISKACRKVDIKLKQVHFTTCWYDFKVAGWVANSVDPDQTPLLWRDWSGSMLFAQVCLSQVLGFTFQGLYKRAMKALIMLREYAGWSEHWLPANEITTFVHVDSYGGG